MPIADPPGLRVRAKSEATIDITNILNVYRDWTLGPFPGEYVVQVKYRSVTAAPDLVQYSPPFMILEGPSAGEPKVTVQPDPVRPLSFIVQNDSDVPLQLPSVCSSPDVPMAGTLFADDGYTSLQRKTDEGTWQVIRDSKWDCQKPERYVRIDPGQAVTIDAASRFQDELAGRGPGTYRWDVVLYLDEGDNRHVLSESFEYGQ